MLQAKQMTNVHCTCIVFALFGNLLNVLHDYLSIQFVSYSYMVWILVLHSPGLTALRQETEDLVINFLKGR